jgi:hypothetical protein
VSLPRHPAVAYLFVVRRMTATSRMSVVAAVTFFVASLAAAHSGEQQRTLSFGSIALAPNEHIVAIEINLTDGRFVTVHIPNDWGVHVEGPIGDCRLAAECGHSGSALRSIHELDRFVTLVTDDPSSFRITATISVTTDFVHSTKRTLPRSQLLLRNV